ncbi:hypothetical protein AB0J89_04405 [Micromonospora chokoriensis]
MLRRRMLGIGLAALLAASVATVASPANAAGAAMAAGTIPQPVLDAAEALAGDQAAAATPTFSRRPTTRGPVTAAAENVITCSARAQYPHASTGGNGIPGSAVAAPRSGPARHLLQGTSNALRLILVNGICVFTGADQAHRDEQRLSRCPLDHAASR